MKQLRRNVGDPGGSKNGHRIWEVEDLASWPFPTQWLCD
jgi:hypothetical protein